MPLCTFFNMSCKKINKMRKKTSRSVFLAFILVTFVTFATKTSHRPSQIMLPFNKYFIPSKEQCHEFMNKFDIDHNKNGETKCASSCAGGSSNRTIYICHKSSNCDFYCILDRCQSKVDGEIPNSIWKISKKGFTTHNCFLSNPNRRYLCVSCNRCHCICEGTRNGEEEDYVLLAQIATQPE